ncbi:hypothetical protein [Mycobacterium sp. OTB74]|uniref:hypothetical protein n=1 Tax=Mycobacterium sp. OTB74 TaxID=1853452 RepID=UPI0024743345|nr:hypothetical protein [Mycobacterium sp. OTB74]
MADTGPLNSRRAAHHSWAKTVDRTARTAPAREAFRKKFLDQVDPDGLMSPADREKAAESARKAFFLDLSKKSQAAREARKAEAAKPGVAARRLAREAAAAQAAAEAAATVAAEAARKAAVALAAATGAAVAAQEAPDDDGGQEHCPRCGAPIPPDYHPFDVCQCDTDRDGT